MASGRLSVTAASVLGCAELASAAERRAGAHGSAAMRGDVFEPFFPTFRSDWISARDR